MHLAIILALAGLFAPHALPATMCANSAPHCVTVSWTPATTRTDGSPISGTTTFGVQRGPSGGPYVLLANGIAASPYEDDTALLQCYTVVQYETNGAIITVSVNSVEACAKPNAPNSPVNTKATWQ